MPASNIYDVFGLVDRIRKEYPSLAFLLDDDEVGPLLLKVADGAIDAGEFTYKLQQTHWWKTTSETSRKWDALAAIDPASAKAQVTQMRANLKNMAGEMGVHLNLKGRQWIAISALRFGWDESQVQDALVKQLKFQGEGVGGDKLSGQAATTFQQLKSLNNQYYLNMKDKALFKRMKRIMSGEETIEGVQAEFNTVARNRYASNDILVKALDNGGTVAGFFEPYRQMIATELEQGADAIDIQNDPKWSQIMNKADDNGNIRPMTLSEAQQHVRKTTRWGHTKGAMGQVAGLGEFLGKEFGAVA